MVGVEFGGTGSNNKLTPEKGVAMVSDSISVGVIASVAPVTLGVLRSENERN